jgi:EmrB/QacA subfamily drug resistance transporter
MEAAPSHREIVAVVTGVVIGMFLAALNQTIISTALPTIARELGGAEHLSWIVSAHLLTATVTTPIYGKLSDQYGRRRLLSIAIVVFVASSVLCAMAQTMGQLVAFRAIQGLGGGGLITLAHAAIADVVSPRERGRYQGYISGMWAAASVGGPILGGFFVDYASWRWIFWINLPLGLVAFIVCRHALRRFTATRAAGPIDYGGAVLLSLGIGALLLVTTWGGTVLPWRSWLLFALALGGLVLLGAFALQELRAPEPLLPPRLFLNPVVRTANLVSFLGTMAMYGATVFLPVYLQLVTGASASRAGLLIVPMTVGIVIGAYTAGQLMRRTGRSKIFPLIGLAAVTAIFLLMTAMTAATPQAVTVTYMALAGIGFGLVQPTMLVTVQNATESRDIGAGTASVNFFRSLGGSFGVSGLWAVLLLTLDASAGAAAALDALRGGPEAIAALAPEARTLVATELADGFRALFLGAAAISAAALLVLFTLEEKPLRGSPARRD